MSFMCPSQPYYETRQRRPLRLLERGQIMLALAGPVAARPSPHRGRLTIVFRPWPFWRRIRPYVALITRLRLDAALYKPAPAPRQGQPGRPRKKGARLPALQHHLDDPATPWQALTIERWYAAGARRLQVYSQTAV